MSYILDALRRADAERALGHAPDLHAQPLPPLAAGEDGTATTTRPALWLGTGLAVGLLGALGAWWWFAPAGDDAAGTAAPSVATAPPATGAAQIESAPPPPRVAAEPAAAASSSAAVAPALNRLPPLPPPAPQGRAQAPAGTPPEGPAPGAAAAPIEPAPRPAQAPVAPKPADGPVPSWREVSGRFARELPQLAFGGTVYSEQRSARLLLLNGRVFREGETIVPDLVVEEIGPRSAVLRYREQRFSLP